MDLEPIEITRKTGEEKFKSKSDLNKISLLEFWQWSTSDLLANTTRGYLAEFIVANDLGVNKTLRTDWKSYDLTSKKGLKIEIKTSAYIQTWEQYKISKIIYSINPSKNYDPIKNRFDGKPFRDSDYYIFCLLHHTDQKTINPLDLDQWAFYVLETRILEEKLPKQKTITLSSLLKLNPVECKYGQINKIIEP